MYFGNDRPSPLIREAIATAKSERRLDSQAAPSAATLGFPPARRVGFCLWAVPLENVLPPLRALAAGPQGGAGSPQPAGPQGKIQLAPSKKHSRKVRVGRPAKVNAKLKPSPWAFIHIPRLWKRPGRGDPGGKSKTGGWRGPARPPSGGSANKVGEKFGPQEIVHGVLKIANRRKYPSFSRFFAVPVATSTTVAIERLSNYARKGPAVGPFYPRRPTGKPPCITGN